MLTSQLCLRRYLDSITEEMYLTQGEQLGEMRIYGILTVGKTWELWKILLSKGKSEKVGSGEDFTTDDALRLFYSLKELTALPAITCPPLIVYTPDLEHSLGGLSSGWPSPQTEVTSSSSSHRRHVSGPGGHRRGSIHYF
jgi:hypothetical protein